MDQTYVISKITCPALLPTVLHRSSLVDALSNAVSRTGSTEVGQKPLYKVVLLCASAGYGKTTLLTDFAKHSEHPCSWYFLDHADADEIMFLELLLLSIRQCFPEFGSPLDACLEKAREASADKAIKSYRLETFIDTLITALSQEISGRFVIMLCNYHEINHNPVIAKLLNRLIQYLPAQCTLVIESRAQPNLDLAPLLARGEIFGMGSAELRFHAEEIQELARLQKGLSMTRDEANQIAQSLAGWVTGILLSTRLGDLRLPYLIASDDVAWGAPAIRTERRFLLAYLAGEVFAREAEAYAFLREASILRSMNAHVCNALLSIQDAEARLIYLEQQGLFVTHLDKGNGTHYICHPILRELLHDELRTLAPERFTDLHMRAVELFRDAQDYEPAIYHALSIPAYNVAANLIESIYERMSIQGYSTILADWIDALPADIISEHPRLLLARANIFLAMGECSQVMDLLDAAEAASKVAMDETSMLRVEIVIARAATLSQNCDYRKAQEVSWQALDMLPASETALLVEVYLRLGVCGCMLCDFVAGIKALRQAIQLCGSNETRQAARLHNAIANAYDMVGLHTLSEHYRTRALHCWEQLDEVWGKVDSFVGLGWTKRLQGNHAEAERFLKDAIYMAQGSVHYPQGEAYALVNLGETYLDQGLYQQALRALEDGLSLANKVGDDYIANYTLCILATVHLLMGDEQTPIFLLAQVNKQCSVHEQAHTYVLMLCELTRGAVFLYQESYDDAYKCLVKLEPSLHAAGLRREQMQAIIGLANCLHMQKDTQAMVEKVQKAVTMAEKYGYQLLCLVELRRYPELLSAIQSIPITAQLYLRLLGNIGMTQNNLVSTISPIQRNAITISSLHTNTPPSLRILALGEPEVYLNNVLVKRWRMSQVMEIFFLLLNSGKPLHKEQICAALWPEADNQPDQALRSSIYYLRKILGNSCVISKRSSYALNLDGVFNGQIWYDVQVFRDSYSIAKAALAANDDVAARSAFNDMTLLYRGDYVSSFYSNWCGSPRSELKDAYTDAHHQLALIAWRSRQLDECISHWHHLLTIDPCLEEAHYGLMDCYAQQGKRGMALRQYQRCATILNDELAVQPGPAIQNLYQSLLTNT